MLGGLLFRFILLVSSSNEGSLLEDDSELWLLVIVLVEMAFTCSGLFCETGENSVLYAGVDCECALMIGDDALKLESAISVLDI